MSLSLSLFLSLSEEADKIVDIISGTESVKQKYGRPFYVSRIRRKLELTVILGPLAPSLQHAREESSVQCRTDTINITVRSAGLTP